MLHVASVSVLVAWVGVGVLAFLVGAFRVRAVRRAVRRSTEALGLDVAVLTPLTAPISAPSAADVGPVATDLLAG